MARIQGTAESFTIAAQRTLEATRELLVRTAKREHARVMSTEPRPATFERFVDGRQGAPEESVKPNGMVLYRYPRLELAVQFAMETLFDLSPVDSGAYRISHMLFLNGVAVPNLKAYQPGDDVAITNAVPYARKIEVGAMTMRVPGTEQVYQRARRKVMARFGNVASVEFTYRGIVGGQQVNPLDSPPALRRRGSNGRFVASGGRRHNRSDLRYPVLIFRER